MISNSYVTKKEIVEKLKISMSTFQRQLAKANLDVPRGLISPKLQAEIYETLGFKEAS